MKPRYYTGASYRSQYSSAEQATYESCMPNACEVVKNKEVRAVYAGTRKRPRYSVSQTSEAIPWLEPYTDPETQLRSDKISIVGDFGTIGGDPYILYVDDSDQLMNLPVLFANGATVQIYYGSQVPLYACRDIGEPFTLWPIVGLNSTGATNGFTSFGSLFKYSLNTGNGNWTWTISKIDLSKTNITKIGCGLFTDLYQLNELLLPDGITEIGQYAFTIQNVRTNTGLYNIVIPDTVTYIGPYAFHGRTINSIEFPEGLKEIGSWSFVNGNGFTTVEIPSTIETIGENAFYGAFSTTATERILRIHKTESEAPAGAPWGATNATIVYDE